MREGDIGATTRLGLATEWALVKTERVTECWQADWRLEFEMVRGGKATLGKGGVGD